MGRLMHALADHDIRDITKDSAKKTRASQDLSKDLVVAEQVYEKRSFGQRKAFINNAAQRSSCGEDGRKPVLLACVCTLESLP